MTVIVVANPKGGVGKSTLATNLAGYFAAKGEWVALADLDKQRSSHAWLTLRPDTLPKIEEWYIDVDSPAKPPKGLEKAVVDTPAGVHGNRLALALELADKVIVPLQPSMFDILATQDFLAEAREGKGGEEGRDRSRRGRHARGCAHALGRTTASVRRRARICRCSAFCAIRKITCSLPRTASRSGTWRKAASRRIWSSGSRSWNGRGSSFARKKPASARSAGFVPGMSDHVQFCVGT